MSVVMREVEVVLTHNGGAEVVNMATGKTEWASDSDENFKEEFPDFLDENDGEHLFDYLVDNEIITDEEAEAAEFSLESLKAESVPGPGDDEDDEDENGDDDEGEDDAGDDEDDED